MASDTAAILADLVRVKALFQQRAILSHLSQPAAGVVLSAGAVAASPLADRVGAVCRTTPAHPGQPQHDAAERVREGAERNLHNGALQHD